jgi:hypothetical protein
MNRFPKRTLILMLLAVLAFFWMWWATHRYPTQRRAPGVRVVPVQPQAPTPAR